MSSSHIKFSMADKIHYDARFDKKAKIDQVEPKTEFKYTPEELKALDTLLGLHKDE